MHKYPFFRMSVGVIATGLVLVGSAISQVPENQKIYRTPNPRGRGWSDGSVGGGFIKPDPNFKPGRTPDGQVDIQGIWRSRTMGAQLDGGLEADPPKVVSRVFDPPDGKVPYKPWARATVPVLDEKYIDPQSNCAPVGLPRLFTYRENMIIQTPGKVVVVAEHLQNFLHIYLDGRPHVGKNMKMWMGDSRGRWEGNTLVIDSRNLNDKPWLSIRGDFFSDQMTLKSRITPVSADILQYEVTIEDPVVFERPFTMAWPIFREPKDYAFIEEYCGEVNHATEGQLQGGRKLYNGIAEFKK